MSAVVHAALSDLGRWHLVNEDRWLADAEHGLYLVSDGMGEALSPQRVIELLPGLIRDPLACLEDLTDPEAAEWIQAALTEVNGRLREERQREPEMTGATLVLAVLRPGQALIVHVGDSRVYLFRAGRLEALTRDHSYVQLLVERGVLTAEEAARRRDNGGPTRYLGMAGSPQPDFRLLELVADDRLLLCSDGLTAMLYDEDIEEILAQSPSPADACRRLVDAANTVGGIDNITTLIVWCKA
jgi:protein phosphatase